MPNNHIILSILMCIGSRFVESNGTRLPVFTFASHGHP